VLHLGHFGVPLGFLGFILEHHLGLLGFSARGTLFNLAFPVIKAFTFFVELRLEVDDFAVFFLFHELDLLGQTLVKLSFFLVPFVQIAGFSKLVSWLELKTFGQMRLVAFERFKFLV